MISVSLFYYRIYDGTGNLLVSTKDFAFARDVFYNMYGPLQGPYQFFVGGYMDDLASFLPIEYPGSSKWLDCEVFMKHYGFVRIPLFLKFAVQSVAG